MTDQSKIPLPIDDVSTGNDAAPKAGAGSLIERAVARFDLSQLASPPIPASVKREPKPAQRNRPAASAPVPSAPVPAAVSEPAPTPQRRSADVPAAAIPERVQPDPEPAVEPVKFSGPSRPIDRDALREQGLLLPEGNVTALLEEFRIVKRQLLLQANDLRRQGGGAAAQRILICSPHPGEGKTYCAINLALSIAAEKDIEVVLVDADFAKPSIVDALGLPGGPGLMDAMTDPAADVASFVMGTDVPGLWVLPAGSATTSDTENLSAAHAPAVLDRLTQGSPRRIVILDSPPALAASPAAELAKLVGQAVMVVRADRTGQGALEDAVSLLSGCPNVQLLLNDVQFSPSGRRFGTYYGYGG